MHLDFHDAPLARFREQPGHLEPGNVIAGGNLYLGTVFQVVLAADARQKLFMGMLGHVVTVSHI